MKKLKNSLVFLIIIFFNTSSFSYDSNPKIFIDELVKDALNTLADKNISISDKKQKIKIIALENVDINALSMYTLGGVRKSLDQDTLEEYKKLFEKYFLKSLTSRLDD